MKKIMLLLIVLLATSLLSEPGDTLKVAVIGNSITIGAGLSTPARDSYPAQLNEFLGPLYDVHNFGVSGRTMLKHGDYPIWNEQFFKDALNLDADIVIILLGTNDSKPYNWIYKDEYLTDYQAMIDTFSRGEKQPQFYLCYPPPAFCVNFDIRDSVITADIIPMVDTMLARTGAHKVDFYTPLLDKSEYFPDCIHPGIDGHTLMAQVLYKEFTGNELQKIQDVNAALKKPVTAGGFLNMDPGMYPAANINDGNRSTLWGGAGAPGWAVISLGEETNIDMFQSIFDVAGKGYQYTIEVSSDSSVWQTVVDQTARADSSQYGIDKIAPTLARFVRFTFTGAAFTADNSYFLREFKVMQFNGGLHAPILAFQEYKKYKTNVQIDVQFIRTTNENECIKMYKKYQTDEKFNAISGYRGSDYITHRNSVKFDSPALYYVTTFKDGMEVTSDTMIVDYTPTAVEESNNNNAPSAFELGQNYPNPFNPTTTIEFYLPESSQASIRIFDLQGRLVRELGGMEYTPGAHHVTWDTCDLNGNKVASGVYFYRLVTNNVSLDKKLLLIK